MESILELTTPRKLHDSGLHQYHLSVERRDDIYDAVAMAEFDRQLQIYYYVPFASCPEVTDWIHKNITTASAPWFNASFTNWATKLAQGLRQGVRTDKDLNASEAQVMGMLRKGFPITDPNDYVMALEYYVEASWKRNAQNPGSASFKKGAIRPESCFGTSFTCSITIFTIMADRC